MKKTKKVTLDYLVKDGQSYEKLKKLTLSNGMTTEIYEKFSNSRIDEMLADLGEFITEYGKTRVMTEHKFQDYVNLYILKWFSTAMEFKTNSFAENIVLFDKIIASQLSEEIFENFDPACVALVYERIFKKIESVQNMAKSNADLRNQIQQYVENSAIENKDEILKVFFDEKNVIGNEII